MSKHKQHLKPIEGLGYVRHDEELGRIVIDMTGLEEPSRVFCAHAIRIDLDPDGSGGAFFSFGQIVPPRRLVGIVVVQLTTQSLHDFHRTVSDEFRALVAKSAEKSGSGYCDLAADESSAMPLDRIGIFKAAVGRCSVGGTGAQLDWYDLSARSIVAIVKGHANAQGLVPILTISMSSGLLKRMVELMDAVVVQAGQPSEGA